MATQAESEAALEGLFSRRVRLLGGISVKIAPTEAGVPDRMVLMPDGVIRLVELKARDGQLSLVQKVWHEKARANGITVVTLYGREQIIRWLAVIVENMGPQTRRPGRPSSELKRATERIVSHCSAQRHDACTCEAAIDAVNGVVSGLISGSVNGSVNGIC